MNGMGGFRSSANDWRIRYKAITFKSDDIVVQLLVVVGWDGNEAMGNREKSVRNHWHKNFEGPALANPRRPFTQFPREESNIANQPTAIE